MQKFYFHFCINFLESLSIQHCFLCSWNVFSTLSEIITVTKVFLVGSLHCSFHTILLGLPVCFCCWFHLNAFLPVSAYLLVPPVFRDEESVLGVLIYLASSACLDRAVL